MSETCFPSWFDPISVEKIYAVDYHKRAEQALLFRDRQQVLPASQDKKRVALLLIDVQNTFCLPQGDLFVAGRSGSGAIDDNKRLCQFMYKNLSDITQVIITMDTHQAFQIFHPIFFLDVNGQYPEPMTVISLQDLQKGTWRVNPEMVSYSDLSSVEDLAEYVQHYCAKLEEKGRFKLTIWPYHGMLGGIGHALVSAVEEAVFFHGIVRQSQACIEMKGQNPLTENYSVMAPEVILDVKGQPFASRNLGVYHRLKTFDHIIIAGQAKSHCVAWTVRDLVEMGAEDGDSFIEKCYVLEDCMSPVVVDGVVDFTDSSEQCFTEFEGKGIHRIDSSFKIR